MFQKSCCHCSYRAGVLALRLARSRPRGSERRASDFAVAAEHLRSALVRDCCYDDALVELVFLEQKERGDCGAARVVARTAIAHANATRAAFTHIYRGGGEFEVGVREWVVDWCRVEKRIESLF